MLGKKIKQPDPNVQQIVVLHSYVRFTLRGMNNVELILTQIERDFGERGTRAAEMLRTAKSLIDLGSLAPRIGETVAYCLREALVEIPRTADLESGESKIISGKVVEARKRYQQMEGLSGMGTDLALEGLLQSIDEMDEFHSREGIHLHGMRQILRARTGVDPLDHDANILNDYQKLIDDIHQIVHNSGKGPIVPLELVSEYYQRVLDLFGRLFLVDERLEGIQALAAVTNPTAEDAMNLQRLLITSHDLRFFANRVVSPNWLGPMLDQGLLEPVVEATTVWPASVMLSRFRDEHGVELAKWLERAWKRWSRKQEGIVALTMAAYETGESGQAVMLRCLQQHSDISVVCRMAMLNYHQMNDNHPDIETFADYLLNPSAEIDRYHKENDIPEKLVAGMNTANARGRIQILVYKIRLNAAEDKLFHVEDRGSIATQGDAWQRDVTWSLIGSLIDALRRAITLGISGEELLLSLAGLPQDLQAHMQAWLRANVDDFECHEVVKFVAEAIKTRQPTGDDLLLIDRILGQCAESGFTSIWQQAIGTPPDPVDARKAVKEDPVPEGLIRHWLWSVVLPPEIGDSWQDCQAILGSALGSLGRDDFLRPSFRVASMGGPNSPFTQKDFESLPPQEVATLMSDWRATADDSWELRSARGVGRQLEEIVKSAPRAWAQDSIQITARLKHPTYIGHYFRGLAEVTDQLEGLGNTLLQAIGVARTHPWPVLSLGGDDFDYDHDWKDADRTGVRLIKALAEKQIEIEEAAIEQA